MAKKHRMLFPVLSETNQMLDCSTGVCDTACPYNCYPYPDYYTISPRPPPLSPFPPLPSPSPSPSPSPPSIPAVYQESPNSSSDAVIIITVASAVLFVLLTGFVIAAKFASNRLNRVTHEEDQSDSEDSEDIFNGEQVDHPIWFIRTTGLQQSIINSITICRYKRGDGLIERTDCPICLNEFEEHESLRLLPKCNHAFHISCIDTWLRSHTNCPLCRASVVSTEGSRSSAPADASLGGSGSVRDNDRDGDGGESRGRDQSENREDPGRSRDETAFKDPTSSSYLDYLNTDPNSNAQMECSCFSHASHQNLQERPGDESKNLDEPEREEQIRVYKESSNRSLGSSINSISVTVIKMENPEFPGKSCQEKDQES